MDPCVGKVSSPKLEPFFQRGGLTARVTWFADKVVFSVGHREGAVGRKKQRILVGGFTDWLYFTDQGESMGRWAWSLVAGVKRQPNPTELSQSTSAYRLTLRFDHGFLGAVLEAFMGVQLFGIDHLGKVLGHLDATNILHDLHHRRQCFG